MMDRYSIGRDAQATVEMAVVCPVLIVLALISYNVMRFTALVARFDRVAPDIVLAHGVAPEGDDASDASEVIASHLSEAMGEGVEIEVELAARDSAGGAAPALVGAVDFYRCRICLLYTSLALLARYGIDLPSELIEEQIAMALDGIVMSVRRPDGRRFVSSFTGVSRGADGGVELTEYVSFDPDGETWSLVCEPPFIEEGLRSGALTEGEVEGWRSLCPEPLGSCLLYTSRCV